MSYRREDSGGYAGRLYETLRHHFGMASVFMDMHSIPPGTEWQSVIDERLKSSDIVLVIIGPHWYSVADDDGHRRLEKDDDPLRYEVAEALKSQRIKVIPVLVANGVFLPNELPAPLEKLKVWETYTIAEQHWVSDLRRLVEAIDPHGPAYAPPTGPMRKNAILLETATQSPTKTVVWVIGGAIISAMLLYALTHFGFLAHYGPGGEHEDLPVIVLATFLVFVFLGARYVANVETMGHLLWILAIPFLTFFYVLIRSLG